ncbi:hypothetical protein [Paenibacillus sp. 481]|uniref:hypothetical protein n=1 Tax=Paenibacillus sp. 481 TaxID=2835869 RepID=UPI001E5CC756|nr:hypothetical protein [Paenibacillus sp. 481]UHA73267.1 hypothetical protein KIK04_22265 [Paenibacillus sp. 481]
MTRSKFIYKETLLPEQVNLELWPLVDPMQLHPPEREIFLSRKKAVDMYVTERVSMKEIYAQTQIQRKNLHRLITRCLSFDVNGEVLGYRALIPNKRVKQYELNPTSRKRNLEKKTGEFKLLLEKHPDIEELIVDLYFNRNRRGMEPVMRPKYIHKKFVEACRDKNIPLHAYPFNTEHMAYRSIYRYLKNLQHAHIHSVAKRFGQDASQKIRHSGIGEANHPSTMTPYQIVQFDGHRIDAIFAIRLMTPDGDEVVRVLERFWILCIIDVATHNIIGYSISLNKEYSASDVMTCIRNAVIPHERKTLSIDNLSYQETGGFPSEVSPEMEWAVWDIISFDNAKSHLANLVQDRLYHLLGCTTSLGPVSLPMRRGTIERFFESLAEQIHRLPNTTGSHPKDPRRQEPDEKAIKFSITYSHLEELVEILISNYNGTPHKSIFHQSPLELLEKRVSSGISPRILDENKRSEMLFMQTTMKRTVRGSIGTGKRPYIQYEGVEYRNDKLANSAHLIGTELSLQVNIDDLRTIRAFLPDGSELGILVAVGKWSLSPHNLQMRKEINKLVINKLIHYTSWDDPVFVYTDYLTRQAKAGPKRDANKITKVKKYIREKTKDTSQQQEIDTINPLENARQLNSQIDTTNFQDLEEILTQYKTITY